MHGSPPDRDEARPMDGIPGLACGVVYSVGGLVVDLSTTGPTWGTAMAFGALAGMPARLAATGFAAGVMVDGARRLLGQARS